MDRMRSVRGGSATNAIVGSTASQRRALPAPGNTVEFYNADATNTAFVEIGDLNVVAVAPGLSGVSGVPGSNLLAPGKSLRLYVDSRKETHWAVIGAAGTPNVYAFSGAEG